MIAALQSNFEDACARLYLQARDNPADGQWHKIHALEGSRNGSGRAKVFSDGMGGVVFCWRTHRQIPFFAGDRSTQSQAERNLGAAHAMHRLHQQSADDLARHEIAAGKVQRWIAAAKPADANHAYLQKKQLPAFGLTQAEANLIVPLSDETGKIWSAQTINQLGHKRFFTGGRKRGLFTPIGWRVGEPLTELIVGEGWATCAAAHLMFQIPAAAAMDCGNLLPAAKTIRKRHPATKLIFASDWDGHAGGIGTTTACEAAHAVGNARVIRPDCTDDAHCDFADNWLQNRGAI